MGKTVDHDDVEETRQIRELVKEKSVTMEYFLEVSHLDAATAEMLKKYDRDGNGSFSKDEVVAIILDLREAMKSNEMLDESNKLFKRLLAAAVCFCILLLSAMFGLSYAVAALTAKTDIGSNGVMTTIDGKSVVATDSTAEVVETTLIEETGANCIYPEEALDLINRVSTGRGVIVKVSNGTHTTYEQVSAAGMDTESIPMMNSGRACFVTADGRQLCLQPSPDCAPITRRRKRDRRLQDDDDDDDDEAEFMEECADELPDQLEDKIDSYGEYYGYYLFTQSYNFLSRCMSDNDAPTKSINGGTFFEPSEEMCECLYTSSQGNIFG
jgi:hypothetical protein